MIQWIIGVHKETGKSGTRGITKNLLLQWWLAAIGCQVIFRPHVQSWNPSTGYRA
jgi:hypothetical protein